MIVKVNCNDKALCFSQDRGLRLHMRSSLAFEPHGLTHLSSPWRISPATFTLRITNWLMLLAGCGVSLNPQAKFLAPCTFRTKHPSAC